MRIDPLEVPSRAIDNGKVVRWWKRTEPRRAEGRLGPIFEPGCRGNESKPIRDNENRGKMVQANGEEGGCGSDSLAAGEHWLQTEAGSSWAGRASYDAGQSLECKGGSRVPSRREKRRQD
jgi:hypothetical protein